MEFFPFQPIEEFPRNDVHVFSFNNYIFSYLVTNHLSIDI